MAPAVAGTTAGECGPEKFVIVEVEDETYLLETPDGEIEEMAFEEFAMYIEEGLITVDPPQTSSPAPEASAPQP